MSEEELQISRMKFETWLINTYGSQWRWDVNGFFKEPPYDESTRVSEMDMLIKLEDDNNN